ncbi:hypothetical protein GOP47_0023500 [Adiantum capillus-veneris]|uniref:PUM-HD domain-containing protein n=1 Tax=Adiantum capillus-veneris TaxID=13818 RepID=A0A9D4U436_ADICA|nr:hypothetical protein GOP47_0023500 [Adiantum capillus-veneris]
MKQEDEEFEKLLGEIPHVTNGASHGVVDGQNDGHLHSQPYPGVMASIITGEDCSQITALGEEMKRCLPTVDEEEEEPLASLGFAESHPQALPGDASLITAFKKATLETQPTTRNLLKSHDTMKSTQNVCENVLRAESMKISAGLKHNLEFTQGSSLSTDLSMGSMAPRMPNNMKVLPKKLGSSTPCANGHSFSGPYRPEVYANCSSSNSRIAYSNGGMMFAYTAGIASAPVRTLKNNMEYTRGHVNTSFLGDGSSAQHGVVSFPHCNGISSYVHENNSSVYYGSASMDQATGLNVDLHNTHVVDRLQVPPSSFYNLQLYSQQTEAHTNYLQHQQDVHQDPSILSYCHAPKAKACKMQLNWQRKEEERQRMQLLFDSHPQGLSCAQHYQGPPLHSHACTVPSFYTAADKPCRPLHIGQIDDMADWKLQPCHRDPGRHNLQGFMPQMDDDCAYSEQGFGSRGDTCPSVHANTRNSVKSRPFKAGATSHCGNMTPLVPPEKSAFCPIRILSRESPRAASPVVTLPCVDKSIESVSHRRTSVDVLTSDTRLMIEKQHYRGPLLGNLESNWPKGQLSSQGKYSSLDEVEGLIYSVAKDQHGCRFLQKQFDEGGPKEVEKIFVEIIDHILELMIDPFGNYLVQKLLEVCNDDQRLRILNTTTANGELINVSLNMHGTRAVQKLIETLTTSEQVSMVTASLRPGVVTLIKDLNGNHVVQRCLQHLSSEDSQFIFEVVTSHCVEIATHRHGCCVLQRCIDFSKGTPQQELIAEIAANALLLSQDPFGNYVVQYVLDLGMPWVVVKVIEQLGGHVAHLSMQKFSSNVVEKCLKFADEEQKTKLIRELMEDSHLLELLQDPYANYVVQSALMVSKGNLHATLVDAICPHMPFLRSSPYGKRILSRRNLKKC